VTAGRRLLLRVLVGLALVLALTAYAIRAASIRRDLREGQRAYDAMCERIAASAERSGSPGAIAHLVSAVQAELERLAERYPRWFEGYARDPGAYPCGPRDPDTQVGSDR
jgi:hypothetical protein